MKRLKQIGDFAVTAVGLVICAAISLVAICATGTLFMALVEWLTRPVFGDWLDKYLPVGPVRLIICTAIGGLVWLCGYLISRARKRRRATENEIKAVLDIQIVEPPPPGRVERFFGSDGALERVFNRCFGWIEKIENDRLRTVVGFLIFCVIAFLVGRIAVWAQGIRLESYLAMIFLPLFFGYMCVVLVIFVGGVVYYAWLAARGIIKWTGQNLPRGLVLRYRQWELRHDFVQRRRLDWLTALVAITLIIIFVAGLKACHLDAPDGEDDSEEAVTE